MTDIAVMRSVKLRGARMKVSFHFPVASAFSVNALRPRHIDRMPASYESFGWFAEVDVPRSRCFTIAARRCEPHAAHASQKGL